LAGHSKWHNIKHRKAAVDAKRGKAWTKCAKAIMVAAKNGGPDPETNLTLRYAIDEARYENMPRDTIERNIKKGAGEIGGEDWVDIRYEGYAPGGVAVVVEALTNNRTRTAVEVRNAFGKYGGNLGTTGCVSFMFETKGVIIVAAKGVDEDRLMEVAIEAGAADVTPPEGEGDDEGGWTILTPPASLHTVRDAIEKAGFAIEAARLDNIPTTSVVVTGETAKSVLKLVEVLEDNDDVQKVFANFDIPEDELAAMDS
jgi:YebC/PmpR family DNA-binding regulatory protein